MADGGDGRGQHTRPHIPPCNPTPEAPIQPHQSFGVAEEVKGSWGHPNRGMGDITAGMACPRAKQGVTACPTRAGITRKRQELVGAPHAGAAELGARDRDSSMAQHGCDSRGDSDSGARAVSHPPSGASLHPWTLPPADAQGNKSQAGRRDWGVGRAQGSRPWGLRCAGGSARVGLGWGVASGVGWG